MKRILKLISLFFLFVLLIVILFNYPFIRGKYRLNKFAQSIELQMDRKQVHKIADDIKYYSHEIHLNANDEFTDMYSFRDIVLPHVVYIQYDNKGKVRDIIVD
jgi:hypothetical protein